jgi:hypothetical protein
LYRVAGRARATLELAETFVGFDDPVRQVLLPRA